MKLPNRIIDLTHPNYVGMPTYDTTPAFKAARLRNYEPDGYRLTALEITTHSGTHIDAPCHFMSGTPKTLSECQVEQFISFGAVLDVPQEPDGGITLEDCERAAAKLGREIEPGEIILLHTGFQDRYGSDPDLFAHHHAFVTGPAAEWLVSKKPKVVGIDATSFEGFGARIPDTSPVAELTVIHASTSGIANAVGEFVPVIR